MIPSMTGLDIHDGGRDAESRENVHEPKKRAHRDASESDAALRHENMEDVETVSDYKAPSIPDACVGENSDIAY